MRPDYSAYRKEPFRLKRWHLERLASSLGLLLVLVCLAFSELLFYLISGAFPAH